MYCSNLQFCRFQSAIMTLAFCSSSLSHSLSHLLLGLHGAGSSAWGFFTHMLLLHLPARLPCWSGYFYEGGTPVFSSIPLTLSVPGLLPLRLPAQCNLGMRSFHMLCASLLCPILGGLFRLSALGLHCLLPFSPSVWLGVCTQLLSILIPALSFPGLCPLRSLLLSPHHAYSVVRSLLPVGRFPWLVRCWLRVPWCPSFSSVFLYGFLWPSRSPAGPVCLSCMLSGFSILLGLLPLLAFSHSGSSCSTIGWTCCGFSCLFRLLSPNPPSLACPRCVLSLMPFHLPWLLHSSGRSVPSIEGILSLWRGFLLPLAFPLSCLGSLSGFFTWFSQSVDVGVRSSFGSFLLLPGFILPLGLFSTVSFCSCFWFLLLLFHGVVSSRVVATCCLCVLSFRFLCGVRSFSVLLVFSAHLPVLSFGAPCFLFLG